MIGVPERGRAERALLFLMLILIGSIGVRSAPSSPRPQFVLTTWDTADGLPHQNASAVVQTRDGYLWAGTLSGLARFNGSDFTRFSSANVPEFESDMVTALLEDREGRLWIGTRAGLLTYEKGAFRRLRTGQKLDYSEIITLAEGDGGVAATSVTGAWFIRDGKAAAVMSPEGKELSFAALAASDGEGRVWICDAQRIFELRQGALTLARTLASPADSLFTADREGGFWVRILGRLARLAPGGTEGPVFIDAEIDLASVLAEMPNGDRWIGSRKGLFYWPRDGAPVNIRGLRNDKIRSICADRQGNVWVGTESGGIGRVSRAILTIYGESAGLTDEDIVSLLHDREGNVWVGTFDGGLCVGREGEWSRFDSAALKRDEAVVSLCQTRDGSIWVGRFNGPLLRLGGQGLAPAGSSLPNAFSLFEDREGRLWIGSDSGLECYDKGRFTKWTTANGLSHNWVTAIAQDKSGAIWAGTKQGLNRLEAGSAPRVYAASSSLGVDEVRALCSDESGALWIGTTEGLFRHFNGDFTAITSRHGLPSDAIFQILEDDAANLWIGSPLGIFCVERRSLEEFLDRKKPRVRCFSYGRREGLPAAGSASGFQPSCMRTPDGRLWFSSRRGIVTLNPARMASIDPPVPVHIEKLLVDGIEPAEMRRRAAPLGSGLPESGSEDEGGSQAGAASVALIPPGAKRLEVHCAALDLSDASQARYRYRLDNYDSGWQEAGKRSVAYYNHLPPGRYRFHAQAANHDGVWNESAASLDIVMLPFYWQTRWFQVLVAGSAAGAVFLLFHLRLRSVRRVQELRLRIARDLHDEVGSSLGNIALLSQIAKQSRPGQEPQPELEEIHEVTVQTAGAVRDVVWFINPQFDTLESMGRHCEKTAERMLRGKTFEFQSRLGNAARSLSLPFRRNVFFIFREALHNIVKHSQAESVSIQMTARSGWFEMVVRDNGKGFDLEGKSFGNGLKNMRQRAEDMGGTLEMTSQPGATVLRLRVPIS